MIVPPAFDSDDAFRARRSDAGWWEPLVREVLGRHGLGGERAEVVAGIGATHATFAVGDCVVKFLGHHPNWREAHAAEAAALRLAADEDAIATPKLLAEGRLCEDAQAPWPYLVVERFPGIGWEQEPPPRAVQREVAAELGRFVRAVHALPAGDIAPLEPPDAEEVLAGLAVSSVPERLHHEVPGFLRVLDEGERVVVHADITQRHTFLHEGRFRGVIDWGDATVFEPHYELAQVQLSVFEGDRELLGLFLDAAEWQPAPDFARRALAAAMMRQAVGLRQHFSMDVFHRLPGLPRAMAAGSLEELAESLYGVAGSTSGKRS